MSPPDALRRYVRDAGPDPRGEKSTCLLAADWVVPVDREPIANAAIVVRESRILAVGASSILRHAYPKARVCCFGRAAIIPGLVNAHTHLQLTSLHERRTFRDVRELMIAAGDLCAARDEVSMGEAVTAGLRSCAARGTTCVVDWRYGGILSGDRMSSIRHVLALELLGPDPGQAKRRMRGLLARLAQARQRHLGLAGTAIGIHSLYMTSWSLWDMAVRAGTVKALPTMSHVAETYGEQEWLHTGAGPLVRHCTARSTIARVRRRYRSVVDLLEARRHLQPGMILVHGVFLRRQDLARLARRRVWLCLCPSSNLGLVGRMPSMRAVLESKVPFVIGCDSYRAEYDVLAQARQLLPALPGNGLSDRNTFSRQLLKACTEGAASALGMSGDIGSLTAGKKADLVVVDMPPRCRQEGIEQSIIREGIIRGTMCNGVWVHGNSSAVWQ